MKFARLLNRCLNFSNTPLGELFLIILIQPYAEELVVNAVFPLFMGDVILFQKSFGCGLYGTCGRKTVFLEKCPPPM